MSKKEVQAIYPIYVSFSLKFMLPNICTPKNMTTPLAPKQSGVADLVIVRFQDIQQPHDVLVSIELLRRSCDEPREKGKEASSHGFFGTNLCITCHSPLTSLNRRYINWCRILCNCVCILGIANTSNRTFVSDGVRSCSC